MKARDNIGGPRFMSGTTWHVYVYERFIQLYFKQVGMRVSHNTGGTV